MSALCVIQARTGSRRFPGKVVHPIHGIPMIRWVAQAARGAGLSPVVAAPDGWSGEWIAGAADALGFAPTGIPEDDVLGRYAQCARVIPGDPIIRLTGDCPAHSADVIRRTLHEFQAPAEYLFSHWLWDLPKGQEVEVFTRELLMRADREATDPADREHVTPWMRRHVGDRPARYTGVNLSVDTPEDMRRVEAWLS